jgi:hypothetical protein
MFVDISEFIDDPILKNVMSKYARSLRDEILILSYKYGTARMGERERQEYVKKLLEQYNPINFEKAVFYNHPEAILEGVYRRTSAKFHEKQKPGEEKVPWQRGSSSKKATRWKNVDWLEVARFDWELWYEMVEFPRQKGHIDPKDFAKHEAAFTDMYAAFTNWYITDFNFKALYFIWSCAKNYSIDFVIRCLDVVEDPRKRNVDYVQSIIKKEFALMTRQMEENKALEQHSQSVIDQLLGFINEEKEPIDWDALDQEYETIMKNKAEFNKVKLS